MSGNPLDGFFQEVAYDTWLAWLFLAKIVGIILGLFLIQFCIFFETWRRYL